MTAETVETLWKFVLVFFLVGLNGFFVATEFALVKMRVTRIEQLVAEGNKPARLVQKAVGDSIDTSPAPRSASRWPACCWDGLERKRWRTFSSRICI